MELQRPTPHRAIVPMLYVGPALPAGLLHELEDAGIGVLSFTTMAPALRLLRHCRVDGVLYGDSTLEDVEAFQQLRLRVIVLAAGHQEWSAEGVTVIDARSDALTAAALIRRALLDRQAWVAA